jgi:hypothetical protein
MGKKDFAAACPALSESQRLDPRPGTLFTLAECEAGWGHLASAFTAYTDYVSQVDAMTTAQRPKHADRRARASEHLKQLEAQVPRVVLKAVQPFPSGTDITLDSLQIGLPMLGVPLPVDPGEHTLSIRRGSAPAQKQTFSLAVGERKTVELLPLKEEATTPPPPPTTTPSAAGTSPPPALPPAPPSRTGMYVAGGVGVLGFVVGGVTGGIALSKKSTVNDQCVNLVCSHEGKQAADSAKSMALVSTIGFGVGLAGVAVAAILYATSSPAPQTTAAWRFEPVLGPGTGKLSVSGHW